MGVIKINGLQREQRKFRHICSYIMQDHLLHPHLTAQEAMEFSVNLKIGKELTKMEKTERVKYFINLLCYFVSTCFIYSR